MKASELVAMVAGLVATYGRLAVEGELKALKVGRPRPQIEVDVSEAVARIGDGGADEFESILAALPVPAAPVPVPSRPRSTKEDVEALVAAVLERAKSLGTEFTSAEIAAQLSKPVGKVSHALHLLKVRGSVKLDGTKRNAKYSVVQVP
jgi:hypothetical protein